MKDFTKWEPNKELVDGIKAGFDAGESEAQGAFHGLVSMIFDELEAHKDGDNLAPRGLMAAMKVKLTIAGFGEKGTLAKSYLNPAFTFASILHSGKASPVVCAIWEGFLNDGADLEGSVTNGPLYTPGRLNAGWGRLVRSEDTPFRADMEGIVAVTPDGTEKAWHTLTIADIKAFNQRGETDPKVGASLMRVLGNPENLDKRPGELANSVKKLRKDNEHLKSDTIAAFCDEVDGVIEGLRGDMAVTLADCEVEAAEGRKLQAEKARIERAENRADAPIEAQPQVKGEPVAETAEVNES